MLPIRPSSVCIQRNWDACWMQLRSSFIFYGIPFLLDFYVDMSLPRHSSYHFCLHIFLQDESKGNTYLYMLVVFRLVHMSFHVSFDISFWFAFFAAILYSLFCLNLLPFLFIFSSWLYLWSIKLRAILVCTSVLVATGCWNTGSVKPPTGRLSPHQSD